MTLDPASSDSDLTAAALQHTSTEVKPTSPDATSASAGSERASRGSRGRSRSPRDDETAPKVSRTTLFEVGGVLRVPLIPRQQSSPLEGLPATEVLPLDCLAEPTEAVGLLERCSRPGHGECWKGIRLGDAFRIDEVDVQPTLC